MRYSIYFTLFLLLFFSDLTMANKPYRGAEYRTIESVTYGRFEVRMKSAFGDGIVSSFFTYHDYDDWDTAEYHHIHSQGKSVYGAQNSGTC